MLGHSVKFLSCLSGSEPISGGMSQNGGFLSCLSGSERQRRLQGRHPDFLSCLSGSERELQLHDLRRDFLSCLSGSERQCIPAAQRRVFLSCLSGSELANKSLPALQNKASSDFAMQTPFLLPHCNCLIFKELEVVPKKGAAKVGRTRAA